MIPNGSRTTAALALAFGLAALVYETPGRAAEESHEHGGHRRASTAAGVMSLDVYASGSGLHLLTGRLGETGERTLWYRGSQDGGGTWSGAVRVDAGAPPPQTFRRGNDAQIAASGHTLVAVWTGTGSGWGGTGPLVTAVSHDSGKTWRRGVNPADSASTTTQSFVDLTADSAGFRLAWIDSRDKIPGLRYAWSGDAGNSWSVNVTVDAPTCECCWNSMITTGKSMWLMYRAHSPRDMALAASGTGATWRRLGTVGAFNWQISACPETGGALALTHSRTLHALVWTGTDGALGLYYLRSGDGGRSWALPRRLGGPDARHADLAAAHDGSLLAVWDDGADNVVRSAISNDGGDSWSNPRQLSERSARASHPRAVLVRGGYRVFWTEVAQGGFASEWKSVSVAGR